MNDAPPSSDYVRRNRRWTLLAVAFWSVAVGGSLAWNTRQEGDKVRALAEAEARASLNRDMAFRSWFTAVGGAYLEVGKHDIEPSPFMTHVAEQNVTTPSGVRLTKFAPATMLARMMEENDNLYGVKGRITGLLYLNPDNAPDPWEERILRRFAAGDVAEVSEVADIDGQPYLRMMRPMYMQEKCMLCHAWTGIPVGGVRGATNVSIPLAPYAAIHDSAFANMAATHGGIWFIGLVAIGYISRRSHHHERERERAHQVLRDSEGQVRLLLDSTAEGLLAMDMEGRCTLVNPAALELLGFASTEALVGKPLHPLIHHSHADGTPHSARECPLLRAARRGEESHADDDVFWRADGHPMPVEYWSHPMLRDGVPVGAVVAFVDVTERKRAEETINHLAYHDALTDLPNRRLLYEQLAQSIAWSHRAGSRTALMYVDLDRFKAVNDTLGHAVGDTLLQALAKRLRSALREGDLIARLGGDEFAVVLNNLREGEDAGVAAEKLIKSMAAPFELEGRELFMTASIGISVYPDDAENINALVRYADIAMYQAKDEGKNTFRFYSEEINAHTLERMELETCLREALEHNGLYLDYQPQAEVAGGRIFGVEALVRWRSERFGLVSPARFIPLAEETGLIVPMGEWILRTACREFMAWRERWGGLTSLAVNLSAVQLRRPELLTLIRQALEESGMPPGMLQLEITESALVSNPEEAIVTLKALAELGVEVSIDDFGTGYSSLSYLKRFPVNELKVDQSFVRGVASDPNDVAITQAVVALGKSLDLNVIAEGVETEEQLRIIERLGCNRVQGYLIGRPMSPEGLAAAARETGRNREIPDHE